MCYWKTAEQFCLMTIPITRSTVNMQPLCWVSRGRELFCGNKQRRKEGGRWVPGWHTEVQRLMWRMERKEGGSKNHPHTHEHKSTAVTSCWVRSRKRQNKDKAEVQRCRMPEEPLWWFTILILLLNVLHGGRGSGWRGTLWPPAAWSNLPGTPSSGCGRWTRRKKKKENA